MTRRRRSGRDYQVAPQSGTAFAMRRQTPLAGARWRAVHSAALRHVDGRRSRLGRREMGRAVRTRRRSLHRYLAVNVAGSPNLGGSLATAGGLVFAGGALDRRLYAFDQETGAELWSFELPAGVHAAPMTYVTAAGRQYLVVAAGGHKDLGYHSWRLRVRVHAADQRCIATGASHDRAGTLRGNDGPRQHALAGDASI